MGIGSAGSDCWGRDGGGADVEVASGRVTVVAGSEDALVLGAAEGDACPLPLAQLLSSIATTTVRGRAPRARLTEDTSVAE
jgi:hypothetical protein